MSMTEESRIPPAPIKEEVIRAEKVTLGIGIIKFIQSILCPTTTLPRLPKFLVRAESKESASQPVGWFLQKTDETASVSLDSKRMLASGLPFGFALHRVKGKNGVNFIGRRIISQIFNTISLTYSRK
jgi:hypothetical protein